MTTKTYSFLCLNGYLRCISCCPFFKSAISGGIWTTFDSVPVKQFQKTIVLSADPVTSCGVLSELISKVITSRLWEDFCFLNLR